MGGKAATPTILNDPGFPSTQPQFLAVLAITILRYSKSSIDATRIPVNKIATRAAGFPHFKDMSQREIGPREKKCSMMEDNKTLTYKSRLILFPLFTLLKR